MLTPGTQEAGGSHDVEFTLKSAPKSNQEAFHGMPDRMCWQDEKSVDRAASAASYWSDHTASLYGTAMHFMRADLTEQSSNPQRECDNLITFRLGIPCPTVVDRKLQI